MRSGRGAGVPELLKLIETLTTDLGKATITEIAELIEQDVVVMSRLLAVANTIYHNPHIAPLSSVSHAIHQVGFQRIRSLAVSLMLIENTGGIDSLPEQREAAAHALCAGLMAQGVARAIGGVDPEMVFACASLRHLGGILMPMVSLEHYRAAQARMKTKPEAFAYRGVFGLTPLELSRELLAESQLPKDIVRSLHEYDSESGEPAAMSAEIRLVAVADVAGRLARLTLDSKGNLSGFHRQADLLLRKYHRLVPDSSSLVDLALQYAEDRIAGFARTSLGNGLPASMVRRIQGRLRPRNSGEAEPEPSTSTSASSGPAAEAASGEAEVRWSAETRPAFGPTGAREESGPSAVPWAAVVEGVRISFEAQEVCLFLPAPGGVSCVLVQGTGGNWSQYRARAALRPDEATVFGVCLSRKKVVAIHNSRDPGIQRYLPEWFQRSEVRLGAFLLIPLSAPYHGLVLIGWREVRQIAMTAEQDAIARQLPESVLATVS